MVVPITLIPESAEDIRLYPESDGKPMGEISLHVDAATDWYWALKSFFASAPLMLVLSNVYMYFEEGNPSARRCPDVMVVRGVRKGPRRVFKTWSEGVIPCAVFEVLSKKTWRQDTGDKVVVYASLGIREYFLFDPDGEYIPEMLRGYRLVGKVYKPIKPGRDGSIVSRELGLRFRPDGDLVRCIDLATEQELLHCQEAYNAARAISQLEQDKQEAIDAKRQADAEIARLRQLLHQREKRTP